MSLASNLGVHIWQSLEMPVYDLTIEPKGHARRWHCLRNRKVESVMQESGQKRKIKIVFPAILRIMTSRANMDKLNHLKL